MVSEKERLRRATAERGFWKEMEERGLGRADAFFMDEHYTRLCEIRRGLISSIDRDNQERRVQEYLASIHREELAGWHAAQEDFEDDTKEGS